MDSMEERATKLAAEFAAQLVEKHRDTNGERIMFTEESLAYLIKKCLMITV